jgi:hypothetical protein
VSAHRKALILAQLFPVARAYFISSSHDLENLTRAETALQELIASIDSSADPVRTISLYNVVGTLPVRLGERRISTASVDEACGFKAPESW